GRPADRDATRPRGDRRGWRRRDRGGGADTGVRVATWAPERRSGLLRPPGRGAARPDRDPWDQLAGLRAPGPGHGGGADRRGRPAAQGGDRGSPRPPP